MKGYVKSYKKGYGKSRYGTAKKYVGYASTAVKALQIASKVAKLVNVEHKTFDVPNSLSVGTTPIVQGLSLILQGTDYNQREGLSIKADSLQIKYNIQINSLGTTNLFRVLIVVDRENTTGVAPVAGDILEANSFTSPMNHTNLQRFRVLHDRVHQLTATSNDFIFCESFHHLNMHMKWSTSAATTPREGTIFILFLANDNANQSTIGYYSRLRYIDN